MAPDDPLAALRAGLNTEDDARPGVTPTPEAAPDITEATVHLDRVVAVLHADSTAVGFLHAGGACGCRYIGSTVMETVMAAVLQAVTAPPRVDSPSE